MSVSLEQQIKCVEREIGMRVRVYPSFVERKKMSQAKADEELANMRAVLETLNALASARKEHAEKGEGNV